MRLHRDRLMLPATALALALACALGAHAQTPRAVSGGSAQLYVGPRAIPHATFGGAQVTPYAWVITSNAGQTLRVPPGRMTHGGPGMNQPLLAYGAGAFHPLFQLYTNLTLRFPEKSQSAVFVPGGRTGADDYVWCPGQTGFGGNGNSVCSLTPSALSVTVPACNPPNDCPNTTGQTMMLNVGIQLGWVRYSRTANQLGGPARGNAGGTFDEALNADLTLPYGLGPKTVAFAGGAPMPTVAIGGPLGSYLQGAVPTLPGIRVSASTGFGSLTGNITATGLTGLCPFLGLPGSICPNDVSASFGAPFTGGRLTVHIPNAAATYVLTGSDARNASGSGNVTLVGGGISRRTFSEAEATRGILTLQVPEPAPLAGLAGALLALAGAHRLARRRSR